MDNQDLPDKGCVACGFSLILGTKGREELSILSLNFSCGRGMNLADKSL